MSEAPDDTLATRLTIAHAVADPGLVVATALILKGVLSPKEFEQAKTRLIGGIVEALKDVSVDEMPQRLQAFLQSIHSEQTAEAAIALLAPEE